MTFLFVSTIFSLAAFGQSGPPVPSPKDNKASAERAPDLQILSSEKIKCGESEYELQTVNNIGHKTFDVRLVHAGTGETASIPMPTSDEYGNFALNWAKATKQGFELSIEWGTRIYHEMSFGFTCQKGRFVLAGIKHETFDRHFPEDANRYRTRKPAVRPNLPFEKFEIKDFMVD
jgi:hypothetical protein